LRWSGSCFSNCPIHGIIEQRPQSRAKSVTKPLYISTLLRGAVRVTITCAYSMWPRCSPLVVVVVVVVFIETCLLTLLQRADTKQGPDGFPPLAREAYLPHDANVSLRWSVHENLPFHRFPNMTWVTSITKGFQAIMILNLLFPSCLSADSANQMSVYQVVSAGRFCPAIRKPKDWW